MCTCGEAAEAAEATRLGEVIGHAAEQPGDVALVHVRRFEHVLPAIYGSSRKRHARTGRTVPACR